ncbi:MAG: hypothetical protein KAI64_04720 [Thermoplasmata archaeon]|nr:hypothetical protein [Thermoplasmata archaeon]
MPDPVFIDTLEGQWTLVAADVITGIVDRITSGTMYLQTYVLTGTAAPVGRSLGVPTFVGDTQLIIDANESVDIYIWSDRPGRVKVSV